MIEQLKTPNLKEFFQRAVKDFVRVLEENAQLDYVDVIGQVLPAVVTTEFDHGLGRQPIGWFFTDVVFDGGLPAPGNVVWRLAWSPTTLSLVNASGMNLIVNVRVY